MITPPKLRSLTVVALAALALPVSACGSSGAGTGTAPASTAAPAPAADSARQDAAAKADARNLVTQIEALAVDTGTYDGVTAAALSKATGIPTAAAGTKAFVSAFKATASDYSVTVTSGSGDTFTIGKKGSGSIVRSCTGAAAPACSSGTW
jgi:hypothetical protein